MTIDIAINARGTKAHITRRSSRLDTGTTRRYNLTPASAARLERVATFATVAGTKRATVAK